MADSINKAKFKIGKHRGTIELTLLGLPSIIFIFVFNYIPLYGLILPFKDFSPALGFLRSPWAGLRNFKFLLTSDSLLLITRNTVVMNLLFFTFNTIFSVIIALLFLEVGRRFIKLFQTIFFIPYFMSWVIVAYVVLGFLDADKGLINRVLTSIGVDAVWWYNEAGYWPFILLAIYVWRMTGYGAVIYYAGLLGIDSQMYEAARIDGATRLQQIRYISLPMITPLITIINILAIGKIFYGDFGLFYNVTLNSQMLYPATDVIDTFVFRALRTLSDFGMASAAGFYQSVCGFILVVVTNRIVTKIDPESSLF